MVDVPRQGHLVMLFRFYEASVDRCHSIGQLPCGRFKSCYKKYRTVNLENRCSLYVFSTEQFLSGDPRLLILLGPEEKERSEHPKHEVGDKPEGGEIDVELSIVGADRKDLEHGKHGDAEDIDRAHIEVGALIDLAEFPDLLPVDELLPRPLPEHIFDVKRVAV